MSRRVGVRLAVAAALGACLLMAAPALAAQGAAPEQQAKQAAIREFDASRGKIDQALDAYAGGQRQQAYRLAVSAYLDHFERVEPTLRVVDSDLTLELEDRYAALREAIRADRGLGQVRTSAADVRAGLNEFEGALEQAGLGAASLAFVGSFSIIFREGLEAVLILAALLGFLGAAGQQRYRAPVLAGVGAAAVASIAAFALLGVVLDAAPVQRELLEAVMTVVAVALLFAVSFWLLQRIEHRHWMEFIRARLWGATARGSALAVGLVAFTAVFREGVETVLFYQALLFYSGQVLGFVALGLAAGGAALAVVGWALLRLRRKLPVKAFMTAAVAMVMALSVAFTGNAVNQLQNLDWLPATSLRDRLPRLPVSVADLTGIHPTVQSLAAQAALALVYIAGFAITRIIARRRTSAELTAAGARQ
jgi:high-affinity iron transporter